MRLYLVATRDLVWVQRIPYGLRIALDDDARHVLLDGRILRLPHDERKVDEIAAALDLVPYALEDGRLVVKRPMASVSRSLPPPPIPE